MKFKSIGNKILVSLIMLALVGMVALVFINAVLRYLYNSSIPAGEEISRYLFIWLSFLGIIIAFKDNDHVGVNILIDILGDRGKSLIKFIGNILMVITFIIIFIGGITYFSTSATSKGPNTGIPFGFISVSILFTSLSMLIITISNIYRDLFKNKNNKGGSN